LVLFSPLVFPIVGDDKSKFQPIWVEDLASCFGEALHDPETVGNTYYAGMARDSYMKKNFGIGRPWRGSSDGEG